MKILYRNDSAFPYQEWNPFPPDAIVKAWSYYENIPPIIDLAKNLWWGYEREFGYVCGGVICAAARLDKPKEE